MKLESTHPDADPETLPYSINRLRRWRQPVILLATLIFIFGGFLAADQVRRRNDVAGCSRCGAIMQEIRWIVFGNQVRVTKRVVEGPVSKAIQSFESASCSHIWDLASVTSWSLSGSRGIADLTDDGRVNRVKKLESIPCFVANSKLSAPGDVDIYSALCVIVRSDEPSAITAAEKVLATKLLNAGPKSGSQ